VRVKEYGKTDLDLFSSGRLAILVYGVRLFDRNLPAWMMLRVLAKSL